MVSAAHLRFCPERGRLLDALAEAAKDYANEADQLAAQISDFSSIAYRLKRSDVEHARMDAQHAREALATHRKEHGC